MNENPWIEGNQDAETQPGSRRGTGRRILRIIMWTAIIIVGVPLALFVALVVYVFIGALNDELDSQAIAEPSSSMAQSVPSEPGTPTTDREIWEYLTELVPVMNLLEKVDFLSDEEKDYLIETYRVRFARPWSTASDEEIWQYIVEAQPMIAIVSRLDESDMAALIESYRAHGTPREIAEGRPGPEAAIEEVWDYMLDLDPSWVGLQERNEELATVIQSYLGDPEEQSATLLVAKALSHTKPSVRATATAVVVNAAVAAMAAPQRPIATPADLMARVEPGVVRVAGGSGFIFDVDGQTAFVATNHHVINGIKNVQVRVENRKTYDALTLGWDSARDVAVLSICCSYDFRALPWDAAAEMEIGDAVVAVGYPQGGGSRVTATVGEIAESDAHSSTFDLLRHTAPLNPGNSGGPVFSMPDGKVLGINTARGTEFLRFYAVPFRAIERQVAQWRSQLVSPR